MPRTVYHEVYKDGVLVERMPYEISDEQVARDEAHARLKAHAQRGALIGKTLAQQVAELQQLVADIVTHLGVDR